MLEIQTKHLQPDVVILEITGRITGKECQQLESATLRASCVKSRKRLSLT